MPSPSNPLTNSSLLNTLVNFFVSPAISQKNFTSIREEHLSKGSNKLVSLLINTRSSDCFKASKMQYAKDNFDKFLTAFIEQKREIDSPIIQANISELKEAIKTLDNRYDGNATASGLVSVGDENQAAPESFIELRKELFASIKKYDDFIESNKNVSKKRKTP